jgi:CRP-like cAMP-binding protein
MLQQATKITSRNRILAHLSADDLALLTPNFVEIQLGLNEVLIEAGGPLDYVYFPQGGMVSLLAVMHGGRCIETATVGNEGAVGAISSAGFKRSFIRAVVQSPLSASRISAKAFGAAFLQSPGIRSVAATHSQLLMGQVQQTVACNALHTIEARLARWLLQTRDRIDSDVLPLTQHFLSEMLGAKRTAVNFAVGQLEQAGVVDWRRGHIVITDGEGLEEVACECYAVVRDQLRDLLPEIDGNEDQS